MATVNKDFRVKNGLVVEGTTATVNGENILTEGSNTDVLDEGTTNLYFTDGRVTDALVDTANVTWVNLTAVKADGMLTITAEAGLDGATTNDLAEGTTNLYFTNQRAIDAVINGAVDTDDIEEGTLNLYFTNARARQSLSAGTGIDYSSTDGVIYVDTTEIATKVYVDEVAQGLKVRGNVEAATTADLGATYSNGTDGVDATLTIPATATLSIDGWTTWSQFDGILVKDQTNAEENGRYFVDVVGDAGTAWVLKRCVDCDTAEEIPGSFVFVQHGNTYEATGWVATVDNVDTFAVGTDDINWVQFSGAGTYTAGNGIALNGTEFSIDFADFTTDNIIEGTTSLYYTDQRVKNVLTGSTQTNISITEVEGALVITAENGVDDATTDNLDEGTVNLYFTDQRVLDVIDTVTTDDIAEGTTNLYFTDQRAVDALEAVEPSFASVDINSVSKQIAVTGVIATAETPTTAYSFAHAEYRSAKLLVKFAFGSHTEVSEVLLSLDSSNNIAITEYAIVSTNGSLGSVTAAIGGTADADVLIRVSVANNNTTATIFGTLIV
jgi:hypothetical protein